MLSRVFLCLLLFAVTAFSQPVYPPPARIDPPDVVLAISADTQTLAIARSSGGSAKRYGRIELWNTKSGELQRTITGFDGPIWSMAFSNDGKSVVTVSTEYRNEKIQNSIRRRDDIVTAELKWWDTETGEFVKRVSVGEEGISSVEASWAPSGDALALVERYTRRQLAPMEIPGGIGPQRIVSGWVYVEDLYLRLLDAQSGERKVKVESGDQTYHGQLAYLARMGHLVFSSDGKRLAGVSGGDVHVWNVETGKKLRTIGKLEGAPRAIAFSPDGRLIAVAAVKSRWPIVDSEITVREVSTGKVVHRLKGKYDSVSCLRFIAEGRALLIGSLQHNSELEMGTVKVWDLRENRLGNYDVHEGKAVSTILHLPQQHAVILQSGTIVELRDVRTWNVLHTFEPTEEDESEKTRRSRFLLSASRAETVGFSRDGMTVSAELPGEGIRSWDSRTGGMKNRIARQRAPDEVTATSSNGEFIAEATANEVRLVDLVSGAHKVLPLRITNRISAMALSRDGRSLLTADDVGDIRIWDLSSGQLKKNFETGQEITAVAIDPTGQLFAAARTDRSIGLWNVATGPLQVELRKHTDVINALAFSPDGKTLASGGDDRTAILWDVASAKVKRTLKGHDLTVTSLSFSPDGLLLASASGNASVVLWNVATAKIERILR